MNIEVNKKLRKVFEDMVDQLQQGQINVDDYENGEILVEGYKQAISDSLDYLVTQFPQTKSFIEDLRSGMVTFDLFLEKQKKKSETTKLSPEVMELIKEKTLILTRALHLEATEPEMCSFDFLKAATLDYEIFQQTADPINLSSAFWSLVKTIKHETALNINELFNLANQNQAKSKLPRKIKLGDYELSNFEVEYLEATMNYLDNWGNRVFEELSQNMKNAYHDVMKTNLKAFSGEEPVNKSITLEPSECDFVEFAHVEFEKFIKDPQHSSVSNTENMHKVDEQKIKMYLIALNNVYNNLNIPRL